ncbi:ERD2 [Cyberlindnera jadinii]|uniref:ERD2 protein n=1 Tax=Cyberlindnera jadinii (strain ATCC 18201 / CBS 1600 / BCRC 20928 / JCM 3617 / NBRC 0987 / NRRL Y-1542) TaxID=983966 RepID=A0A0H5C5A3_CYBJN|nr:ERD2 [Cyberlindnera jadinii]
MNVFRIAGDISHLASIFILIHQITITKSVQGISFKTQLLYSIVFITRYLGMCIPIVLPSSSRQY